LRLVPVEDFRFFDSARFRAPVLATGFVLVDFLRDFRVAVFAARLVEMVFFLGFRDADFFDFFLAVAIG
jgi:hypothetical protein